MKGKRTKWIIEKNPAIPGVYERDYSAGHKSGGYVFLCYWDGKRWSFGDDRPNKAYELRHFRSANQDLPWRGLAEKPE